MSLDSVPQNLQIPQNRLVEVGHDDIFIYENIYHEFAWCYKIKLDGITIYVDLTGCIIDDSQMINGEMLTTLAQKGIANFDKQENKVTVKSDKWQEYFDASFTLIIQ